MILAPCRPACPRTPAGSRTSSRRSARCPWPGWRPRPRSRSGRPGTPARARRRSWGWPGRGRPRSPGSARGARAGGPRRAPRSAPGGEADLDRAQVVLDHAPASSPQVTWPGRRSWPPRCSRCRWCTRRSGRSTPSMVRFERSRRCGAQADQEAARSWTWARRRRADDVSPSARTAAMMAFSVAVADASSRNISTPRAGYLQLQRPVEASRGRPGWERQQWRRAAAADRRRGRRQAWPVRATSGAASSTRPGCGCTAPGRARPGAGRAGRCGPGWARPLHRRPGRGDQLQHRLHVQDPGHVAQQHRLVGQR